MPKHFQKISEMFSFHFPLVKVSKTNFKGVHFVIFGKKPSHLLKLINRDEQVYHRTQQISFPPLTNSFLINFFNYRNFLQN